MTDINYKEGMKLTDEDWDEINRRDAIETDNRGCIIAEVAQEKCLRAISSMELPELLLTDEEKAKCVVVFDGEVGITASMDKTAEAQLRKLQPIIAAQIGYRGILRDDVVQLQNELDKQIVENEGLKKQLSTARAEVKELETRIEKTRQHAFEHGWSVPYLAPDKEGGM